MSKKTVATSTAEKFPLAMRALHWLSALIILSLIAVGWWMTGLPKEDPSRGDLYGLHKSFGVLILLLVTVRLIIREISRIPSLPEGIKPVEKIAAKAAHFLLYCFMFSIPLLGYAMSNSFGHGVQLFGIPLPTLFSADMEMGKLTNELHAIFAYSLLVLIVLHALGALKHRFFDRKENDVLGRML